MPRGIQPSVKIQTPATGFLGLDTASEPTSLDLARSRRLYNAYQGKFKALTQRPGSAPVNQTPLGAAIRHITRFPFEQEVSVGAAPTLSAVAGAATLPADTYYVRYTYVTDNGETQASAEASQAIVLGETLRIVVPAIPFHANSINIYISTASNAETLRYNQTATTKDVSDPLPAAGKGYPTVNTTEFRNDVMVASGMSLYSFYNGELRAATMTDALVTSDIYDADFTGVGTLGALVNVKIIADGGDLKRYLNGTVADVAPAADDTAPAAANVLTNINAKGIKYVWEHSGHIFVVPPNSNEVFYSKRAGEVGNGSQFDYFPETYYELLVKNGDYVNGCGVPFDSVQFIPMRRKWNVWSGENFDTFDSSKYLNTVSGVIAPRSIDIAIYPNGFQTIIYLSDDGVNEIFTTTLDTQGRQYATRNIMTGKIDWEALGFTHEEMEAAVSQYIVKYNMYLLEITRDTTKYVFGYDTRNAEWYMWTGLTINSFLESEGVIYFAGDDGFLKSFDPDLNDDWTNYARTTGTPIDFDRISGMIWYEDTGYPSTLDYYILRLREYAVAASLDVSIIYLQGIEAVEQAIQNAYLVWDVSAWDEASWANLEYTDLVSAPIRLSHRLRLPKKGYYFQVRWRNARSEPVEIYAESFIGRTSGEV